MGEAGGADFSHVVMAEDENGRPAIVPWSGTPTPADGDPHSIQPVPPTVSGLGPGGGSGDIAVSTEMLRSYAAYLGELIPPLQLVQQKLRELSPRTGQFYQADELRTQIGADDASGLRGNFDLLCGRIIETLTDVRNGVEKMAADYDTTEEINGATAEQLLAAMPDVAGDIQGLTQLLSTAAPPATI